MYGGGCTVPLDTYPTSEPIQPTWQHNLSNHVDSRRLSQLVEDSPETPLPHPHHHKAVGSPISTHICLLCRGEEGRIEESKKKKAGEQLNFLCAQLSFLFSSSRLKLRDTHLSLIAHRHSTHEKVLWICINTAYGGSSAGTRCVQKVECCRCIILHSNYHSKNAAGSGEVFATSLDGAGEELRSCETAGTENCDEHSSRPAEFRWFGRFFFQQVQTQHSLTRVWLKVIFLTH